MTQIIAGTPWTCIAVEHYAWTCMVPGSSLCLAREPCADMRLWIYSTNACTQRHVLTSKVALCSIDQQYTVKTLGLLQPYFMPPKKKENSKELCCICCQPIYVNKDEALYCSRSCQQWLHHYCASVTSQKYQTIKENAHAFLCPCCDRKEQQEQINSLKT